MAEEAAEEAEEAVAVAEVQVAKVAAMVVAETAAAVMEVAVAAPVQVQVQVPARARLADAAGDVVPMMQAGEASAVGAARTILLVTSKRTPHWCTVLCAPFLLVRLPNAITGNGLRPRAGGQRLASRGSRALAIFAGLSASPACPKCVLVTRVRPADTSRPHSRISLPAQHVPGRAFPSPRSGSAQMLR